MDNDLPDGEAIEQVARGSTRALADLHRRHLSLARGVAFRVLRNHALAEDAVQEAFLDLWRTAGRYQSERSTVQGWICMLVHRRAVDIARQEARRALTDGTVAALPEESYSIEEVVVLRAERRRVQDALGELESKSRQLIELAYYGGLSQTQVAARLGLPLGTVKSRTFTALAQLRLALGTANAA